MARLAPEPQTALSSISHRCSIVSKNKPGLHCWKCATLPAQIMYWVQSVGCGKSGTGLSGWAAQSNISSTAGGSVIKL